MRLSQTAIGHLQGAVRHCDLGKSYDGSQLDPETREKLQLYLDTWVVLPIRRVLESAGVKNDDATA